MSDIGHNSIAPDSNERLISLVDRIERLNDERKNISDDIKDVYVEAKSAGYDVKVLRRVISDRAKDAAEVEEQDAIRDMYLKVVGLY